KDNEAPYLERTSNSLNARPRSLSAVVRASSWTGRGQAGSGSRRRVSFGPAPADRCRAPRESATSTLQNRSTHSVRPPSADRPRREIALITGGPGEAPPHPLAIPHELLDRRSG